MSQTAEYHVIIVYLSGKMSANDEPEPMDVSISQICTIIMNTGEKAVHGAGILIHVKVSGILFYRNVAVFVLRGSHVLLLLFVVKYTVFPYVVL